MVEICNGSGVPFLSHNNYLVIYMKINGAILVKSNMKQTKIGPHFRKQLCATYIIVLFTKQIEICMCKASFERFLTE